MPQQFQGKVGSLLPRALSNLKPTVSALSARPSVGMPGAGGRPSTSMPIDYRGGAAPVGGTTPGRRDPTSGFYKGYEAKDIEDAKAYNEAEREKFDKQMETVTKQREYRQDRPKSLIPWAVNIPEDPAGGPNEAYLDPGYNWGAPPIAAPPERDYSEGGAGPDRRDPVRMDKPPEGGGFNDRDRFNWEQYPWGYEGPFNVDETRKRNFYERNFPEMDPDKTVYGPEG